jgi:hypothetical protein
MQKQQQEEQRSSSLSTTDKGFSMLASYIGSKLIEVGDRLDMIQKTQAGMREQIYKLDQKVSEVLERQRS